ncbi:MAG: hypothetical protein COA50_07215 [Flavobacteriaceae bacterium]|nr:MAG: hypothetical protein COA50_07215 [Flavobacteriaceae bacterium]
MKKIQVLLLGLILITSYNCKDAKKEAKEANEETELAEMYSIVSDSTAISFTAYKTSAKAPVGGKFTKINLEATSGSSPIEALNDLQFSIPVSSLFTNDATGTRDPKIIAFFFDVMDNTELISGTFSIDADNKCSVDLKLNGVSAVLPLDYEVTNDNHITFKGTLNLEHWNALDALASLNKACGILHTGDDGVSKTWNDVAIEASVYLEKK